MPNPRLIVKSITRTPASDVSDSLEFTPGVNTLVGPPNAGKTKLLEMFNYLFGSPDAPVDEFGDLAEKYTGIAAILIANGSEVKLERDWGATGARTKMRLNGEEILTKDVGAKLCNLLGIPVVHYPQGNPYSPRGWPELSWRSLFRHIYRRQYFWNDIADKQPKSEQHACLLQFLGLADKVFPNEYGELVSKEKKLLELESRKTHFLQVLDEVSQTICDQAEFKVAVTPESISQVKAKLKQQLEELHIKRRRIAAQAAEEGLQEDAKLADQLSSRLLATEDSMTAVKGEIAKTAERLNDLQSYYQSLLDELNRLERAVAAGEIFADLRITHCPACDQPIKQEVHPGECFLCKQELGTDASVDAAKSRIDFEKSQVGQESDETKEQIASFQKQLGVLHEKLRSLHVEHQKLREQISPMREKFAPFISHELGVLDAETGAISQRIRQLDSIEAALSKREVLNEEISELSKQIEALSKEVNKIEAKADFATADDTLCDGINQYLGAIESARPGGWSLGRVEANLSERDFKFKLDRGVPVFSKVGGTLLLYFLISYHFALMRLSAIDTCKFPGLTILDYPAEIEGESVQDKVNFTLEPFVTLLAKPEYKDCQVIAVGSAFENLMGANQMRLAKQWV